MADSTHYAIRGGLEGRERLRILARVMRPSSLALLDRLGLSDGQVCLDVGCGGGDVTLELARRVAPRGRAVGIDIDEVKLRVAREEAEQQGVPNVEFRLLDIRHASDATAFDAVYSRFLLTHLSDPAGTVNAFYQHLRPGGFLAVEDIDCSGQFTYPESKAFGGTTSSTARRSRGAAATRTSGRNCRFCSHRAVSRTSAWRSCSRSARRGRPSS